MFIPVTLFSALHLLCVFTVQQISFDKSQAVNECSVKVIQSPLEWSRPKCYLPSWVKIEERCTLQEVFFFFFFISASSGISAPAASSWPLVYLPTQQKCFFWRVQRCFILRIKSENEEHWDFLVPKQSNWMRNDQQFTLDLILLLYEQ